MKIRPLHDRVIVKRLEEDRTTASGIVIPESVEGEKPDQGTIQAILGNTLANQSRLMVKNFLLWKKKTLWVSLNKLLNNIIGENKWQLKT